MQSASLQQQWDSLKANDNSLKSYDVAQQLSVSELELVVSKLDAGVTLLNADIHAQFRAIESLGEVLAITRNHSVIHAKVGTYNNLSLHKTMGLAFGEIDLRIFMKQFCYALAVDATLSPRKCASLQFFNGDGIAVHKVFLLPQSNHKAYEELVATFKAPSSELAEINPQPPKSLLDSAEQVGLDLPAFEAQWRELKDVHHFMALLKKHHIERVPAYRAINDELALELQPSAFKQALEMACEQGLSIMVFVGSPGLVQIYTGQIHHLGGSEEWFSVMDERFSLHAKLADIDTAWRVRKPSRDGIVTSLEVFNAKGEQLLLLFGEREEGKPEQEKWQQLLENLCQSCPA